MIVGPRDRGRRRGSVLLLVQRGAEGLLGREQWVIRRLVRLGRRSVLVRGLRRRLAMFTGEAAAPLAGVGALAAGIVALVF